ncbi:hypothetical protein D9611_004289 [Ephemerocybe angulata]|uniref:ATP synthase mitochondrial F1 complex assembly factor 2 n=1 Tax=Ephemerocybe angulata TaxID=980116 RepID=A0A8H5BJY1_9AGAR|nr:hypothetical protein D9611_004289 [Tulosesus angulatus]
MLAQKLGRYSCTKAYPSSQWKELALRTCGRARWNSSVAAAEGLPQTDTNKAEVTLRRFWKDVGLDQRGDGYAVTLDKRALKTPSGNTLLLPKSKRLVASLIAAEWDHQETLLKHHALPLTSIASRATDTLTETSAREEVEQSLLKYFETDTVCFFDENSERLARLQKERWVPLIDWARKTFDVEINVSNSVLSPSQPTATKEKLFEAMESLNSWELAALERATLATKSFIIGMAVVKRHLNVEQAALAASAEVDSQIQVWGEVEDTHDVDYQDVRRQLGSAALLLVNEA